MLFQHRNAVFFGAAGVHGAFKHHVVALLQHLAYGGRSPEQRLQVGLRVLIDWRWYGHDEERSLAQHVERVGKGDVAAFEVLGLQLAAGVDVLLHQLNALGVDIEANDIEVPGKFEGNRQAYVAEADNGQRGFFADKLVVHCREL